MPEKPRMIVFNIVFFAFFIIMSIFTVYEITIVGNPFFDPVTPYLLWICLFAASVFFLARYINAKKQ